MNIIRGWFYEINEKCFLCFVAGLVFFPTITSADSAGWQTILSGNYTATSSGSKTTIAYSGGGDIRLCVSGIDANNNVTFYFYSDNGSAGSELIPPIGGYGYAANSSGPSPYFCFPSIDVRPYVDGSNNKAEIYIKMYSRNQASDTVYLELQD